MFQVEDYEYFDITDNEQDSSGRATLDNKNSSPTKCIDLLQMNPDSWPESTLQANDDENIIFKRLLL